MANLMEAYKKRLTLAESVYSKTHQNEKMPSNVKLATAMCLKNINKFMNEAFDGAMATQRADMGEYKKFCINLTNVAIPNLIANELVIVSPMSSMSGNVAYVEYVTGTAKGEVAQDTVLNSFMGLGKTESTYTGSAVVEPVTSYTSGTTKVAFTPVVAGSIKLLAADGTVLAQGESVTAAADGTITGTVSSGTVKKIAYVYDNVVIPQETLPTVKAVMRNIPLLAHARRVAVYYSQIAAFEAKTDYGFDLGEQLAEKAVGQLQYEIDTEVVELLADNAAEAAELHWSKSLPVGVSKTEHYEGFTEIVEIARQKIYDATKRFAPNYMIIASDVLPVLTFIKGFTAASATNINGPYFAGTLNSLKVFVSPSMKPGEFVVGVNGSDMMSSAAVYAPYMAIVPTQLLQFADGATSQGFSTLYDLKMLNANLLVKGKIEA